MASSYPGALDSFTNPTSTDAMDASAALYHDVQHSAINDAVEAVQAELGTDPAGAQSTVKARLEHLSRALPSSMVWVSGGYILNSFANATSSSFTAAVNTVYYLPWWCPASVTVDRIAVEVTTLQSAANARLAIFSADATTNGPGALLLDAGEVDCSTNSVKELTISQSLSGGVLYWLALLNETANVVFRGASSSGGSRPIGIVADTGTTTARTIMYETRTYTSGFLDPASAAGSLTLNITGIVFWLRRT